MSNSTWLSDATMGCPSRVFGPTSCDGSFDFTLLFEQTILSIAPSAIFLCCLPVSLFKLHRAAPKFRSSHIRTLKLVSNHAFRVTSQHSIDNRARLLHPSSWLLKLCYWPSGRLALLQQLRRQCLPHVLDSLCLWL